LDKNQKQNNKQDLMARVPRVEFGQDGGRDTLEHLLGEDTQQLPANVQGFEDSAVLIVALQVQRKVL